MEPHEEANPSDNPNGSSSIRAAETIPLLELVGAGRKLGLLAITPILQKIAEAVDLLSAMGKMPRSWGAHSVVLCSACSAVQWSRLGEGLTLDMFLAGRVSFTVAIVPEKLIDEDSTRMASYEREDAHYQRLASVCYVLLSGRVDLAEAESASFSSIPLPTLGQNGNRLLFETLAGAVKWPTSASFIQALLEAEYPEPQNTRSAVSNGSLETVSSEVEISASATQTERSKQPTTEIVKREADAPRTQDHTSLSMSRPEPVSEPHSILYPPENVQFTAYRPRSITSFEWRKLLVYAHLDDGLPGQATPIEQVHAEASRLLGSGLGDYANITKDSRSSIPREAEIQFVPRAPDARFNPPSRSFFWVEGLTHHREEFEVRATTDAVSEIAGSISVYLGMLLIAELPLRFKLGVEAHSLVELRPITSRPYRNIFPSYSRQDDPIVRQLEAYARTLGDRFLKDVTVLRAGEEWSPRLLQMIEKADVFQLFWSSHAAQSREVEREWRHALSQTKAHFIRPTYWEQPMPPAPQDIRHLHFERLIVPNNSQLIVQPLPQVAKTQASPLSSQHAASPPATTARPLLENLPPLFAEQQRLARLALEQEEDQADLRELAQLRRIQTDSLLKLHAIKQRDIKDDPWLQPPPPSAVYPQRPQAPSEPALSWGSDLDSQLDPWSSLHDAYHSYSNQAQVPRVPLRNQRLQYPAIPSADELCMDISSANRYLRLLKIILKLAGVIVTVVLIATTARWILNRHSHSVPPPDMIQKAPVPKADARPH